eukprot:scaffold60052_cov59-Phaeocystis_antarctica.AAC.7
MERADRRAAAARAAGWHWAPGAELRAQDRRADAAGLAGQHWAPRADLRARSAQTEHAGMRADAVRAAGWH